MSFDVKMRQARCAALGHWPGPLDGQDGPRTRAALAAATAAQAAKGLPFMHPSGITRAHWHWTGGAHKPNALDRKHYHALVHGDGSVEWLHEPTARLSHTLNANGGAIGLGVCGMAGATERPWSAGPYAIRPIQIAALVRETARMCHEFDLPVSRWSTLSHAEIQPTLGIRQRGKIDFIWLPGFAGPKDPISTGDVLREMTRREVEAQR